MPHRNGSSQLAKLSEQCVKNWKRSAAELLSRCWPNMRKRKVRSALACGEIFSCRTASSLKKMRKISKDEWMSTHDWPLEQGEGVIQ